MGYSITLKEMETVAEGSCKWPHDKQNYLFLQHYKRFEPRVQQISEPGSID